MHRCGCTGGGLTEGGDLKKDRKTTVMSYTITTIEVSFINVLVLSLSNLGSTNKSHHLTHTWLWQIPKDLNFLIYANTASPLRFIFLTWACKKNKKQKKTDLTENFYGGYNILGLQGTTVIWISILNIFIYISILKSTEMGKLVTYFQFLDFGIVSGFTIHLTDSLHQIIHLVVRLLDCGHNLIWNNLFNLSINRLWMGWDHMKFWKYTVYSWFVHHSLLNLNWDKYMDCRSRTCKLIL